MAYAALAIVAFIVQNLANKEFSRRFPCTLRNLAEFDALALAITAAVAALVGGATPISTLGFFLALAFGVVFVATCVAHLSALNYGPFGLTSLIVMMSMMIPAACGIAFFGESVTLKKVGGIACMALVLALSAVSGPKDDRRATVKWLALAVTATVLNGSLSVMQKAYSAFCPGETSATFNFYGFVFGAITAAIVAVFMARKEGTPSIAKANPRAFALTSTGLGLGSAGGNIYIMMALGALPSSVVYPLVQGALVAAIWLASIVVYRERLTPAGLGAILLCVLGFVLLS